MPQTDASLGRALGYQPGPSQLGRLISIEGIAGSGKTTQSMRLAQSLKAIGVPVDLMQDLTGTGAAKAITSLIDAADTLYIDATAEMLLSFAARRHFVNDVISPTITTGKWVISEGFTCSAYAYFHNARGIDEKIISDVDWTSTGRFKTDLTVIVDVPAEVAEARLRAMTKRPVLRKRYQHEHQDQILREAYHTLAGSDPEGTVLIDGSRAPDVVALDILTHVTKRFSTLIQPTHG